MSSFAYTYRLTTAEPKDTDEYMAISLPKTPSYRTDWLADGTVKHYIDGIEVTNE